LGEIGQRKKKATGVKGGNSCVKDRRQMTAGTGGRKVVIERERGIVHLGLRGGYWKVLYIPRLGLKKVCETWAGSSAQARGKGEGVSRGQKGKKGGNKGAITNQGNCGTRPFIGGTLGTVGGKKRLRGSKKRGKGKNQKGKTQSGKLASNLGGA